MKKSAALLYLCMQHVVFDESITGDHLLVYKVWTKCVFTYVECTLLLYSSWIGSIILCIIALVLLG